MFAFSHSFIMHQSIPAVPIPPPPPGNRGAFAHVVSPGGGALANFIAALGLGISTPRGDPRAFGTHVFERWVSLSGRIHAFVKDWQGLEKPVNDFKGIFSQF